ncbi:glutathione S-transferase [Mortierella sp. GBAus27b]|nr:hypothetical protein BGX31_004005 [Mortierella sp. GBA43]KAI8358892.1 glutathione S-transferase [Mortierella sp. GBAus27b]
MTKPELILYNNFGCPYAARAVIAIAETKADPTVIDIDITVPRPDWYLQDINPYGQVPALKVDNKDVILESLIVVEYLAELYPEAGLLPENVLHRAKARYLIQHWNNRTGPVFSKAAFVTNDEEAAEHRRQLVIELEKVNKLLLDAPKDASYGEGPYYFGNRFSIVDVALAPHLARLFLVGKYNGNKKITKEDGNLARLFEWQEALESRTSVKNSTPDNQYLVNSYRKFVK